MADVVHTFQHRIADLEAQLRVAMSAKATRDRSLNIALEQLAKAERRAGEPTDKQRRKDLEHAKVLHALPHVHNQVVHSRAAINAMLPQVREQIDKRARSPRCKITLDLGGIEEGLTDILDSLNTIDSIVYDREYRSPSPIV